MCGFQQALQGILADGTPVCKPVNPDVVPPRANIVFPFGGLFACGQPEFVMVAFSEPMDTSTINPQTVKLSNLTTGSEVAGTFTFEDAELGPVWRFIPEFSLPDMTEFQLTITTAVKDIEGNRMAFDLIKPLGKFCGTPDLGQSR